MTADESDSRLREIREEWQRWCRGQGVNVPFLLAPIDRQINAAGPCEPLTHVAMPAGKDSRGWTKFTCQRCGVFLCYGPPEERVTARLTPPRSTITQGNTGRNSRRSAS